MSENQNHYDLLIIGAGPIGMACAIEAQKANLSYIIIEKGALVNSLFNYPVFMTFFSTSQRLEIGGVPFVTINPKPNRNEAVEYYRRVVEKFDLKINLFERVEQVDNKEEGLFEINTSKTTYTAKNVVVATGFYDVPLMMNIPGEDLPKVTHYYKDPHLYAFQNVVVVGANNSGVDAALETYRKGANVTMVVRSGDLGPHVKYWVRPDIQNRIKEGEVTALFNSELVAIRENEVDIKTPEGIKTIANDFVIAMTGYQPDFSMLRKFGIDLPESLCPFYNEETMETNVKGLYLAGVVCGGLDTHKLFIENSRAHAEMIVKNITG
ncbi:YpdA family putative bacillithiol disulfide reductase [Pedobacter sp. HDW13]|uniref:YpdA family putative bacillithiol disulfide reductase n=1 Tax=unclassified Pedobacter TaxID=2628915 RepID=UPI000F5A693A|nr:MULTISPECIES: YpdA family putative bacillithiol disulfide reductase [unclassified Pedobacter]QIL40121.1 YpdA family putative bacillithiol disulfide reductase [Pedobacter sp. HDW13]RQO68364.1 YpdA family putative bacillithiol disulfide reductase [Pedobacter sp. KBW01]